MSDEGFHEIQLNGKQLVFLLMAATVVSVVIFLCGVMVGRGVRAERGPEAVVDAAASSAPAAPPDTPTTAAARPPRAAQAPRARAREPRRAGSWAPPSPPPRRPTPPPPPMTVPSIVPAR